MAVSLGLQANFGLIRSNRSIDIPGASERVAQDSGGTANAVSAPAESARPVEAVSSPGDVRNDKTGAGSAAQGSQEDESASAANPEELSEDEQKQVDDLKSRDTEVRNHEQAHAGVTVMIVTHNREISRVADRVVELSSGTVVGDGPPPGGTADIASLHW